MRRKTLRSALIASVCLLPTSLVAGQMLAGCGEDAPAFQQASGSSSTTGTGGADTSSGSATGGMGGSSTTGGTGGAGGGVFVDDAGVKACPDVPNAAAMVTVPGWNGVSGYCVDATEVTNAQYAAWLATNPDVAGQIIECSSNASFVPATGDPPSNNSPVISVDWCDAYAYCKAVGKRLCGRIGGGPAPFYAHDDPSRNMWFNACSHGGTQAYPYGQAYDANACNVSDAAFGAILPVASLASCEGGFAGLNDMSGNVWEWEDSCVPEEGGVDVCRRRGGGFASTADLARCAVSSSKERDYADARTGFRCCAD